MAEIELSSMKPADAAAALRSLPRRFADAARAGSSGEPDDDTAPDEVANRPGPSGHSVVDVVRATTDLLADGSATVEQGLIGVADPPLPAHLVGPLPTISHLAGGDDLAVVLDRLGEVCERFASVVDRADAGRWLTDLPVDGGGTTTPLALVQSTVAAAVAWLREVEPIRRAVRGR